MRQIGVALDDDLRERLDQVAKAQGRSVADEVRSRLERTLRQDNYLRLEKLGASEIAEAVRRFEAEIIRLLKIERENERLFDEPTQELARDIMNLARDVGFSANANWHQHSLVHAALAEAINAWLDGRKPSPNEDDKDITEQMKQRNYDPKSFGKTVAHLCLRRKEDLENRKHVLFLPAFPEQFSTKLSEMNEALKKGKPKK
jgi:hypothetical protein